MCTCPELSTAVPAPPVLRSTYPKLARPILLSVLTTLAINEVGPKGDGTGDGVGEGMGDGTGEGTGEGSGLWDGDGPGCGERPGMLMMNGGRLKGMLRRMTLR